LFLFPFIHFKKNVTLHTQTALRELNIPQHPTILRLLDALTSGEAGQLEAAVKLNTSFFFPDSSNHSVELPAALWGFHTPYGFCPVLLQTMHAVAVAAGQGSFVKGSTQYFLNTDQLEQWDEKVPCPILHPST
jgi:hypothetical protein